MSRGGQRGLAVVVVLLMLGAAVLVRGWLDDDGGKPPPPRRTGGSASPTGSSGSGRPTLLCASELGDVCRAIQEQGDVDVRIEPAAESAQRLASENDVGNIDVDGWLTVAPQSGIVDDAQHRNGRAPLFASDEVVARSPLVFVGRKDRMQTLTDHCQPGGITWACIGRLVGTPWSGVGGDPAWNEVTLGHADPATSTTGLVVLGQEATSELGKEPQQIDLTATQSDAFLSWFQNLEANVVVGGADGPLAQMVQLGAGSDVAEVTEAEACTRIPGSRVADTLSAEVPEPMTTADVVFAAVRHDGNADAVRAAATGDTAQRALRKGNWRIGRARTRRTMCSTVGPVALGPSSNLPDPGVLVALAESRGGG